MLKEPIPELEGKNVAIIAMGNSQLDYHKMITHSKKFDEVWAINAMIGVLKRVDRAFVMDPVSRFFDTEDAGNMTVMMKETLPTVDYPIYTCELDKRVAALEEYPIKEVVTDLDCGYFNNTIAYAIAFALWNNVGGISMFGADFTYKGNLYFAEQGRGCCEFWLAKCIEAGIIVQVALTSGLLDADVPVQEKLYGYHRLEDPYITYMVDDELKICKWSEVEKQQAIPMGLVGRHDGQVQEGIVEPKKY
jgi:hypothetical protein|tara:strand:+ start:94 stop:837 length:744 start_codon:yes stop_codon:yes gene_type:complete